MHIIYIIYNIIIIYIYIFPASNVHLPSWLPGVPGPGPWGSPVVWCCSTFGCVSVPARWDLFFPGFPWDFPYVCHRLLEFNLMFFFNGKSMDVMACWDFPWISARVVVYVFCCSNFWSFLVVNGWETQEFLLDCCLVVYQNPKCWTLLTRTQWTIHRWNTGGTPVFVRCFSQP